MQIDAAVVREGGGAFEIESVELDDPKPDEVLIDITAAGVCHTDLSVRDQYYPTPLPAVLGHEGSGIVREVGRDVTDVESGDHVVASFDYDGICKNCHEGDVALCDEFFAHNFAGQRTEDGSSPLSKDGERLSGMFFGQSSFATQAITKERNGKPRGNWGDRHDGGCPDLRPDGGDATISCVSTGALSGTEVCRTVDCN